MSTRRTPPPPLELSCPPCPMCDRETYHDGGDGLVCDHCSAWWRDVGSPGEWYHPDAEQCPAIDKPFDYPGLAPEHEVIRHTEYRCLLDLDHDGDHADEGGSRWNAAEVARRNARQCRPEVTA